MVRPLPRGRARCPGPAAGTARPAALAAGQGVGSATGAQVALTSPGFSGTAPLAR